MAVLAFVETTGEVGTLNDMKRLVRTGVGRSQLEYASD